MTYQPTTSLGLSKRILAAYGDDNTFPRPRMWWDTRGDTPTLCDPVLSPAAYTVLATCYVPAFQLHELLAMLVELSPSQDVEAEFGIGFNHMAGYKWYIGVPTNRAAYDPDPTEVAGILLAEILEGNNNAK